MQGRLKIPYCIDLNPGPEAGPVFPDWLEPDENGLIAVGGELTERVLTEAYTRGIFPWFVGPPVMWFSPDPRLVLFPGDFHVSKRLARNLKDARISVSFDRDFEEVISNCAAVQRKKQEGTWICDYMKAAYCRLHEKYLAHCVSVYRNNELCGGLYGVSLGRIFFGESMFSLIPNASKIALYYLVEWVKKMDFLLIDCQVPSEHLIKLGAVAISRTEFNALLSRCLSYPTHAYPWY